MKLTLLIFLLGVGAACVLAAAAVTLWLRRTMQKRLGGYTGDCLGAVQQAAEVAFYVGLLGGLVLRRAVEPLQAVRDQQQAGDLGRAGGYRLEIHPCA